MRVSVVSKAVGCVDVTAQREGPLDVLTVEEILSWLVFLHAILEIPEVSGRE